MYSSSPRIKTVDCGIIIARRLKETVACDRDPLSIYPKLDGIKARESDSLTGASECMTFQQKSAPIRILIGKLDNESSGSASFIRLLYAKRETSVGEDGCDAYLLELSNATTLTSALSQMLDN
ncbi:hypothetical protein NPIL_228881 [Nephila pilipes]|uniref:Uncharacterized protein n=1 Tax=Nephila pilipes TaxID=299642 RepID=A0A8X6TTW9_NEPPI|nr:hypothetical protein NPIL_228881 [Nephila pilipes]